MHARGVMGRLLPPVMGSLLEHRPATASSGGCSSTVSATASSGGCCSAATPLGSGADWPLERPPDEMETSQPLMYAVGDVRHGSITRIATAMGEGALVVKVVQDRLAERGLI